MNEQMSNAANMLIERALSGLDTATDFLQAEIPEYVYQLILWYGVKSAVLGTLALLVFIVALVGSIKYIKAFVSADEVKGFWYEESSFNGLERSDASCYTMIFGGFASIIFLAYLSDTILEHYMIALQIWIAPKVWLVEYASTLIK